MRLPTSEMKLNATDLRASMRAFSWNAQTQSDQAMGVNPPPVFKEPARDAKIIALPAPDLAARQERELLQILKLRRSVRKYANTALSLNELSYLLYAQHGYQGPRPGQEQVAALRTTPAGGCRHAIDTYVAVMNVSGLESGIYYFMPKEHSLALLKTYEQDALREAVSKSCNRQIFAGNGAVALYWAANIYRSAWRYPLQAHKLVLIDSGHICQNLYLAAGEVGCGVCAIAAYDQENCDALIGLDGEQEYVIYIGALGKLPK